MKESRHNRRWKTSSCGPH